MRDLRPTLGQRRRPPVRGAAVCVLVALSFLVGLLAPPAAEARQSGDQDLFLLRKNFEIFGALYERLVLDYTDPIDAERLLRSGMAAMLAELDPYTVFYDEADNVAIDLVQRGRVGDIGVTLERRRDRVVVGPPQVGTSAYRQGLRPGDVVRSVDGREAGDLSIPDIRTLLRGSPGSFIEVVVERPGSEEPLRFRLRREIPSAESVSHAGFLRDDTTAGIGYVRLERFGQDASRGVTRALRSLKDTGSLRGVILDLRGNPGGLLEDAIAISQLFLPPGTVIVSTRGRLAGSAREYRSKERPLLPDVPLVILVDGLSASASEIVAGAIQDHDRGVILGEPTFGKGLVQIFRDLPYNTSLKVTTARYFTPSGRSIQSERAGRPGTAVVATPAADSYATAGGRSVRAGNGIEPDVPSTLGRVSDVEQRLDQEAAFARFVDDHLSARAASDQPPDFDSNDAALLATFRPYALDVLREVPGELQRELEGLRTRIGPDASGEVNRALDVLNRAAEDADRAAFDNAALRMAYRLRAELASRAGPPGEQVRARLRFDPDVRAAAELLQDRAAYQRQLQ